MRNKLQYIYLIILPLLLLIITFIYQDAIGEYYLFSYSDGPYGLLLSSLSLAQLKSPGYFQHPGIVPQLITVVVIKITHLFQGDVSNIVSDVFDRPEFYLGRINHAFIIITVISLFVLGIITYKKTGNIFAAVFLQFTPFISSEISYQIARNTCETTSVFLTLLLLTVVVSFIYEQSMTEKKNLFHILSFGIVCGLGLANKISILPVMLIPFLLIRGFRNKGLFILSAVITFSILFFSFSPQRYLFFQSLYMKIFQSGKTYASGPANFNEPGQVVSQLKLIFMDYSLFSIIYLLIFFTLVLQFVQKFKPVIRSNKYFLLLIAIFIIQSGFILLVVKTHLGYYILPALLFSVIGLFGVNSIIYELFPKYFKYGNYVYIYIFLIILTIPQIIDIENSISKMFSRKEEALKVVNYLENNYPESIVISSDVVSSLPSTFYNALMYSGKQKEEYHTLLKKKYPDYIYFNRWKKDFVYLDQNPDLKNRLMNTDSLVYHSFNDGNFAVFKVKLAEITKKTNITAKEVFASDNNEKLYMVYLK